MTEEKINRRMSHWVSLNILVSKVNLMGWFVLIVGAILFGVLSSFGTFQETDFSFIDYLGTVEQGEGTLTNVKFYTEIEDGDGNVTEHYAFDYRFETPNGMIYEDVSFGLKRDLKVGAKVVIEYPTGKPYLSRVKGMQRELHSPWIVLFPVVPTLIGLGVLLIGLRQGMKIRRLLRRGSLADGEVVHKEEKTSGESTVHRCAVSFVGADGEAYQITETVGKDKLSDIISAFLKKPSLADQKGVSVLYLPSDPEGGKVMTALPGSPEIDGEDQVRLGSFVTSGMVVMCVILAMFIFMGAFVFLGMYFFDYLFYGFLVIFILVFITIVVVGIKSGGKKKGGR